MEGQLMDEFSTLYNNSEIAHFYKDSSKLRALAAKKVQSDLKQAVRLLKKLNNLKTERNVHNIDLEYIKKGMTGIQGNIQELISNTKVSLEGLEEYKEKLLEEMMVLEGKTQNCNISAVDNFHEKRYPKPKKNSMSIPWGFSQELADFIGFVTISKGHTNGWSSNDHSAFLKCRAQCSDVHKLATKLRQVIPDMKEADIISHEEWYQQYSQLKEIAAENCRKYKLLTRPRNTKVLYKHKHNNIPSGFPKYLDKEKTEDWKISKVNLDEEGLKGKREDWKISRQRIAKENKKRLLATKCLIEKKLSSKYKELKVLAKQMRAMVTIEEKKEKLLKEMEELREQNARAIEANKLIELFQSQDNISIVNKMESYIPHPKNPVKSSPVKDKRTFESFYEPKEQWILQKYYNNELYEQVSKTDMQFCV